jgi:hypothetical protein
MKEILNDVPLSLPFRSDQLLPLIYLRTNFKIEDFSTLHLFYLFSQNLLLFPKFFVLLQII